MKSGPTSPQQKNDESEELTMTGFGSNKKRIRQAHLSIVLQSNNGVSKLAT